MSAQANMNEQTLKKQWFTFSVMSTVHGVILERHMRENGLLCICGDYSGNPGISASLSELILSMKKRELAVLFS